MVSKYGKMTLKNIKLKNFCYLFLIIMGVIGSNEKIGQSTQLKPAMKA
jgi:hypothetical protein